MQIDGSSSPLYDLLPVGAGGEDPVRVEAVAAVERTSTARQQRTSALGQNGVGGYGAGSQPFSFTDGTCFFNGTGSLFGDIGHGSPMTEPWMQAQASDPAT